uniref:Uncharacterized protein n=1 Tax=Rhizophora mucronata TaxID=61149 RepID=A0A2P2JPJ3_RHIMU
MYLSLKAVIMQRKAWIMICRGKQGYDIIESRL